MTTIHIYTDGGCRCNPGIGAYAFAILNDREEFIIHEDAKFKNTTTNNEMELSAMYASLNWIRNELISGADPLDLIKIYSDSAYAIGCVRDWGPNWIRQRIINQKSNAELVLKLCNIVKSLKDEFNCNVEFVKVKGHDGNPWNEHVDKKLNECMDQNLNKDTDIIVNGQSYTFLASIDGPIDTVQTDCNILTMHPGYYRIKFLDVYDGQIIVVKLVNAMVIKDTLYITCIDKEDIPIMFRFTNNGWDFVDPDYCDVWVEIIEHYNCMLWKH